MDKMVVKVLVTIKAKVTESLKAKLVATLKENVQQANMGMEQFEFDVKRAINEQANVNEAGLNALQQDIEVERQKRLAAKADVEAQLKRAEKLELGSEIGHGQIERTVEVEVGSDLEELMGAEIVVEDGKIIAFRA